MRGPDGVPPSTVIGLAGSEFGRMLKSRLMVTTEPLFLPLGFMLVLAGALYAVAGGGAGG